MGIEAFREIINVIDPRRTIFCNEGQKDVVQAALNEAGLTRIHALGSPFVPVDTIYIFSGEVPES